MKKYAVIVAGGSGTRMGSDLPKQFMLVNRKPVLYYPLSVFLNTYSDLQVILVLPEEHLKKGQEIIDAYFDKNRVLITEGGDSRFQSVKNGLKLIGEESIIFVHDAVRCMITPQLIERCYELALSTGSAIPVMPSKDSVRLVNEEGSEPLSRDKVMLVQTPQTFHSKILLPAYQIDYKEQFTDEATVVEAYGLKISLVKGEDNNIKITKPFDLLLAEKMLEEGIQ